MIQTFYLLISKTLQQHPPSNTQNININHTTNPNTNSFNSPLTPNFHNPYMDDKFVMKDFTTGCSITHAPDGRLIQVCPKELEPFMNTTNSSNTQDPTNSSESDDSTSTSSSKKKNFSPQQQEYITSKLQDSLNENSDPNNIMASVNNLIFHKQSTTLPSPKELFAVMKNKLRMLEKLEDSIKKAFHTVGIATSMVQWYTNKIVNDMIGLLKKLEKKMETLERLKSNRNKQNNEGEGGDIDELERDRQNNDESLIKELNTDIFELNGQLQEMSTEYNDLKQWLKQILQYFNDLYEYRS